MSHTSPSSLILSSSSSSRRTVSLSLSSNSRPLLSRSHAHSQSTALFLSKTALSHSLSISLSLGSRATLSLSFLSSSLSLILYRSLAPRSLSLSHTHSPPDISDTRAHTLSLSPPLEITLSRIPLILLSLSLRRHTLSSRDTTTSPITLLIAFHLSLFISHCVTRIPQMLLRHRHSPYRINASTNYLT